MVKWAWIVVLSAACGSADVKVGEETGALTEAAPHEWQSYRFVERSDDAACTGAENPTAVIEEVVFAQTHAMSPDWPFFFLVGDRPVKVEVSVTGEGASPDVSITAAIDGEPLDALCMVGPAALPLSVDATVRGAPDRFAVTLPSDWIQPGLSVTVQAGASIVRYSDDDLGVRHAPELNLMLVMMDVVNYNDTVEDVSVFDPSPNFLEDIAGAMPVSTARLGRHAVRLPLPTIVVGSTAVEEGAPAVVLEQRLCRDDEVPDFDECDGTTPVSPGDVNAAALRYIDALQHANGHWGSHYYYGHTGALFPGGWGGGKTFVSGDYTWVTIHELGHAASLPHWGDAFLVNEADDEAYEYPWGGVGFDGGGRGPTWSYIQQRDLHVSPTCEVEDNEAFGTERSDAMQRNNSCAEWWDDAVGPWDGFSDFSAYAMFRYMTGAATNQRGWVDDPLHGDSEYNLPARAGFPVVDVTEAAPEYVREDGDLPRQAWEVHDFLKPAEHNRPVFTIYGTYHPGDAASNVLHEPIRYMGDLPRLLDPTDPETFEALARGMDGGIYGDYFWWPKDLTFKVTYRDGTTLTALYPYGSVDRDWSPGFGPWRWDLLYFGINVPADVDIERIEVYERPFLVRYPDWTDAGNIANPDLGITADAFMDDAVLVMELDR